MNARGALLIAGTHSGVGKSTIATALCRYLSRSGVLVAPFKAENVSLNSAVTAGGAELARAQWRQAQAAGVEPTPHMNPVLVKPKPGGRTAVHVLGKPYGEIAADRYPRLRLELLPIVRASFERLASEYDVVVCEGMGAAAEINQRDLANFGLAGTVGARAVLVGDIERGGVFASLYGTWALLSERERELVGGFLINRVRSASSDLSVGISQLEAETGLPTIGALPHHSEPRLDAEDSVDVSGATETEPGLEVVVVRLPWLANATDFDPLRLEPGVDLRYSTRPADIERADLAIVPGTRATTHDLIWLKRTGVDQALRRRARAGAPVLGVCGGYQMLGEVIEDGVESPFERTEGLALLPVSTQFSPEKTVQQWSGRAEAFGGIPCRGYRLQHGRLTKHRGAPFLEGDVADGCADGAVIGTSVHGLLESDRLRQEVLKWVAATRGVTWRPNPDVSFALQREREIESLADWLERSSSMDQLTDLVSDSGRRRRQRLRPRPPRPGALQPTSPPARPALDPTSCWFRLR